MRWWEGIAAAAEVCVLVMAWGVLYIMYVSAWYASIMPAHLLLVCSVI